MNARKRWATFLVSLALATTTAVGMGAPAQAALSCQATFTYTLVFSGGFTASVGVTNNGTVQTSGWTVRWRFPNTETVTSFFNANGSQSGKKVTASNVSFNGVISPGGSVSFGLQGTSATTAQTPTSVTCTAS